MATLYVTEFRAVGTVDKGWGAQGYVQAAEQPPVAEQTVAIGGSSTPSSAFNAAATYVRLHADAICSIEFGANPTATVTTARMAAGATEYFSVPRGGALKVAVITNT